MSATGGAIICALDVPRTTLRIVVENGLVERPRLNICVPEARKEPSMSEELRACPFCGGPAQKPDNQAKAGKSPIWEISCYKYCVSMRRATRRDAIAAWNTRPSDGLRDALKSLQISAEYALRVGYKAEDCGDDCGNGCYWCDLRRAEEQARASLEAK
jgi:hypothetical protein